MYRSHRGGKSRRYSHRGSSSRHGGHRKTRRIGTYRIARGGTRI